MRVIIKKDYSLICDWVAHYIVEKIKRFRPTSGKPFVLGLPTGSTPLGVYNKLIELHKDGKISFKNVITFNMDEYVNLSKDHPQSYYYYMWTNFFNHIDISPENVNILDGTAKDLNIECCRYEEKIKKVGGIDLFLGGVGTDGHIAFNEPGSSLKSRTRVKTLCQETIISNSRFFENEEVNVPTLALTVGIGTIMDSREVLVIINGSHKSNALQQCLEGNVNNTWTITALQNHEKALIVCDKASTSELKTKTVDYFNNLQKTTNMFGETNNNYLSTYINSKDKIVVFSPHPDDDVIGLGGVLQKFNNKSNVLVVYMTDGSGGFNKDEYEYNPRKQEAVLALKILGYKKSNTRFLELPFYKNKRIIGEEDSKVLGNFLEEYAPQHIFVCYDSDPNKTHDKCYEIIRRSTLNKQLKYVWLYNSAWGDWNSFDNFKWQNNIDNIYSNNKEKQNKEKQKRITDCVCFIGEECMRHKILSVMMHDSQDPPVIYYEDYRPFHEKIVQRNSSKLNPGYYEEHFKIVSGEQFKLMKREI